MIRKATMDDVDSIAEIIVSSWKTAYAGIVDEDYSTNLKKEKYITIFRNNIEEKKELIFVYDNIGVKGFVSGVVHDGAYDCEVIGLYISPLYQGQKIGTALLKRIMEEFKNYGKRKLIIWTLENAKNNTFYRKMGGQIKEYKNLQIGGKEYQRVGFTFCL